MRDLCTLNQKQLDALRELGNIGCGNAATALAQFLNRRISMSVPNAQILPFSKVAELAGGPEERVMGIYLRVLGKIKGSFLLLMPERTTIRMLKILIPTSTVEIPLKINDFERSCLCEMGNILAGSFLNALSAIVNVPMFNSIPSLAFDMAGALIDSVILGMGDVGDHVLMVETMFTDNQENLKMHIFLLPDPVSLELILSAIGVN
ncbi:chemotaxis protein CheC [bacterium]|nr:chemotaxis protein CheC [bacterium]